MKPLVVNDTEDSVSEEFLVQWLNKLSDNLISRQILSPEKKSLELSLVFLKELEAKRLNWNYRNKDYATDVLTFQSDDPESFGELVFCMQVLKRQAKDHQLSFDHELGYLVLHGILHLLGYDHEAPGADAEKMLKMQDEIFDELIAPPKSKSSAKSKNRQVTQGASSGKASAAQSKAAQPKAKVSSAKTSAPKSNNTKSNTKHGAKPSTTKSINTKSGAKPAVMKPNSSKSGTAKSNIKKSNIKPGLADKSKPSSKPKAKLQSKEKAREI